MPAGGGCSSGWAVPRVLVWDGAAVSYRNGVPGPNPSTASGVGLPRAWSGVELLDAFASRESGGVD
jgi:hypothetical protein